MLKLGGWPRLSWGRIQNAIHGSTHCQRDDYPLLSPPCRGARGATVHIRAIASPSIDGGWTRSDVTLDAQADVPLADWPRAQLAFKDSMVRGILQFAPRIAFRCALHRCESRDIHCRESCQSIWRAAAPQATKPILGLMLR
ncbi:hypothetical protein IEQ34_026213 [Dendrobium chrysotoxum]|uniref:Uncharacterized protein n=1 Tax=Dendrobium chrysotoxum TaxID=161865 RepID=A0AAV7FN47_DENCH|nr:hypothetical protein IEQ34_026213 [Dendrobium chrysotoxum]